MRSGQEPGQDFSAVLPPPPPADIDHAWVFEEGLDNGFEDYVTVWRGSLLACTLDVEKRTPALAFREHINAERKRRGDALYRPAGCANGSKWHGMSLLRPNSHPIGLW